MGAMAATWSQQTRTKEGMISFHFLNSFFFFFFLAGMKEEELEPILSLLMGPPAPVELAEGEAKYWRTWYGSAGTLAFLSAFYSAFFADSGARCGAFNGPFRPMIPQDGKEGTK